jgi:8-oxo-dGTP pyrophosphatase MutT (NUDIX family)
MPEPLADEPADFALTDREVIGAGRFFSLVRETLSYGGTEIAREFMEHPGAVAVLALDDDDRVLLIQQYRHPVRSREWELPAGLLDVPDEPRLLAAQRELAEETGMAAAEWHQLVDLATSPGGSNEIVTVFLARGLVEVASDYVRDGEEADIEARWVPIDDVADAASAGRLRNGILIAGVFAALAARASEWRTLRPLNT